MRLKQAVPTTLEELYATGRVKFIAVGKCALGEDWEDRPPRSCLRELAHAHWQSYKREGVICFRNQAELGTDDWLSRTAMHELAHLISHDGHGERWRRAMRQLGQPIPVRYRHKPRRKD